jgi:hypothetical protein
MTDTITLYGYNETGYYNGQTKTIASHEGYNGNWTITPLPEIPSGQFAKLINSSEWQLTSDPEPIIPPIDWVAVQTALKIEQKTSNSVANGAGPTVI